MPEIVGPRHARLAAQARKLLAKYEELRDIIALMGLADLSPRDRKAVIRARRLRRFLTQPMSVTETFTGQPGAYVSTADALDGCEAIMAGACDDMPEPALYMGGRLADMQAKGGD